MEKLLKCRSIQGASDGEASEVAIAGGARSGEAVELLVLYRHAAAESTSSTDPRAKATTGTWSGAERCHELGGPLGVQVKLRAEAVQGASDGGCEVRRRSFVKVRQGPHIAWLAPGDAGTHAKSAMRLAEVQTVLHRFAAEHAVAPEHAPKEVVGVKQAEVHGHGFGEQEHGVEKVALLQSSGGCSWKIPELRKDDIQETLQLLFRAALGAPSHYLPIESQHAHPQHIIVFAQHEVKLVRHGMHAVDGCMLLQEE